MKPRGGFLQAAEGAAFTFLESQSILVPSSCFVSLWMQPFHFHLSLAPRRSLTPASPPIVQAKEEKNVYFCALSGISILCQTLAASISRRRTRLAVLCPLHEAALERSIAQTAAHVSARGPGLT